MTDARLTRRRFLGVAAGTGALLSAGPLVVGGLGAARGAVLPAKGVSPGKLMYRPPWEVARALDIIRALTPGGSVRTDLDWAYIERTRGAFDWEGADRAVHGAVDRGLRPLLVLATAPPWANGAQHEYVPPIDPAAMAPFSRAAAARYGPLGAVFEVWNEPNVPMFWPVPEAGRYTALLKVVSDAVKGVSPATTVLTGGLAPGVSVRPADFLRGIYANGGARYFDAVGYHPYSGRSSPMAPGSGFLATEEVRAVMVEHGDGAKQVWGTEVGWRVELLGLTEDQQSVYLQQAYARWRQWQGAGWAGPLLWYNLRDHTMNIFDQHTYYGLHRNDWSPRPSYWALLNA